MAGLSAAGARKLEGVLARHVESGAVPGLVAAVTVGADEIVLPMGHLEVERTRPVQPDSLWRLASTTKAVTAAAVLALVEDCRVRLDDPIRQWLPEMAEMTVLRHPDAELDDVEPAREPITVRQCMNFTLGTGVHMAMPDSTPLQRAMTAADLCMGPPSPDRMAAPDDWIARLGALPLYFQPGRAWMYQGGSEVLGVLVARVTGRGFPEFVAERILEPLGIGEIGFSAVDPARLATAYAPTDDGLVQTDPPDGEWSRPPRFPAGGSGLVGSAPDFLRFGTALLRGGTLDGARILSPASVAMMTSDQLDQGQKDRADWLPGFFDTTGWGYGVSVVTRATQLWETPGRYGWDGGLGCTWANDPAQDLAAMLVTQVAMTSPQLPSVMQDFWTALYAALD
jgi:CubicO group peptidase (beta-lactamase class C family)